MQVQVHTDATIQGGDSLEAWVREEAGNKLARLKEHVVRVEVFLSSVDALKATGGPGKKCVLETRANGRQPVAVNAEAEKVREAFSAALEKLRRAVESDLDKVRDTNIRESVRGAE
ncbi:MAG: HPF/RaiA family ribosome-associated protein, partial [Comamonadaceae bacterium]|nr:HPF/RaiA family ribosome-associated protein [Comamonadaceae bacterium]